MAREIVGKVINITTSSNNGAGILDFECTYFLGTFRSAPMSGRVIVKADITQNDTQLTAALRQGIADYVNTSVTPNLTFTSSDVVGLNV